MIFRRKMQIYGNNLISQYAKNPYYLEKENDRNKFPFWAKIVIPVSSVLLVGLIFVLTLTLFNEKNSALKYEILYVDSLPGEEDSTEEIIIPWDEKTYCEKYKNFSYNDFSYSVVNNNIVDEKYIDFYLSDVTCFGFDEEDEELSKKEHPASIFKIKDIDNEVAVLVKFEEENTYHAYRNGKISFDTMQDIYDKIFPQISLEFTYTYYYLYDSDGELHYIRFDDFDDQYLYKTLLDQVDLPNLMKDEKSGYTYDIYKRPFMVTSYKCERMGVNNVYLGIAINEDGYLIFTFNSNRYVYEIGEDKANEYKNYVLNNIRGYELILKETTDQPD